MKKILIIIFVLILIIITSFVILPTLNKKTNIPITTSNPSDESGNDFPFALSPEQINQSLMQNKTIIIAPVKKTWPEEINNSLLNKGWKPLGTIKYFDGGSTIYYYFKTKDVPSLEISYWWDSNKGQYKSLSINFIHPAQIGSWLIKLKSKLFLSEDININVESLMDCQGILSETRPGSTECIIKNE